MFKTIFLQPKIYGKVGRAIAPPPRRHYGCFSPHAQIVNTKFNELRLGLRTTSLL